MILSPVLSVICPVYDTGVHLRECFSSIEKQSFGIDKVEVIFINDASTDDSLELLCSFQKKYPLNVVIIDNQQNLGIARSRNLGLERAKGRYVTFLDSDDKWSIESFERIIEFFEKRYEEIDVVFSALSNFDGKEGDEYNSGIYETNGVIDVCSEYQLLELHLNNAFFKREAISDLRFGEFGTNDEELVFVTSVVDYKLAYGHVPNAVYYYRKRMDNSNYEQHVRNVETYYQNFYCACAKAVAEHSISIHGKVSKYAENMIMHLVMRRLRQKTVKSEFKHLIPKYLNDLGSAMQFVSDDFVISRKSMPIENEIFALRLKYGERIKEMIKYKNGRIYFNDSVIYKLAKKKFLRLALMEIKGDNLVLHGRAGIPFDLPYRIYFWDSRGKKHYCDNYSDNDLVVTSIDQELNRQYGFRLEIPKGNQIKITAYIEIGGENIKTKIDFGKWAKLSNEMVSSYYYQNNIVVYRDANQKAIRVAFVVDRTPFEEQYCQELASIGREDIISIRKKAFEIRELKEKPIWLFADRINTANENAEFLFEYVKNKHGDDVDSYYVIGENSKAYRGFFKKKRYLRFYSEEFRDMFLVADKYVVSQTSDFITYPSIIDQIYLRDMLPPIYVYLQHGVLEKDISKTQNKITTNFNLYVTSAYPEYEYMFIYPYGFEEDEVLLSGLARHDLIIKYENHHGKEIVVAPTWRHYLSNRLDLKKGGRGYNHEFVHSEFYKFYNSLINDERILRALAKKGYKGVLRLHHYMREQAKDFKTNKYFKIADGDERYDKQFKRCALLITDYSSIASDYAYAKKPVIYCQFDREEFYEGHSYDKGFFDYEEDGFGPVCYDYESTVSAILDSISNNCVMNEKYIERRKNFFAYFDGYNRERMYNAIKEL